MAEYTAQGLSPAQVQAAINLCGDGDTLVLPDGDYSGFSGVTLNHHVSIRGQGGANTIIRKTNDNANPPIFQYVLPSIGSPPTIEIKDFIMHGHGPTALDTGIRFYNAYYASFLKIHDVNFHNCGYAGVNILNYCKGVIYSCNFIDCYYPGYGYGVSVQGTYLGDSTWGDWVWATWPANTDPDWGTDAFLFVEDCYFLRCRHSISSDYGAKFVFRHNRSDITIYASGTQHVDMHGRGPGYRGVRAAEVYENSIGGGEGEFATDGFVTHGGDCLVYNNTFGARISDSAIIVYDNIDAEEYPDSDQMRGGYFWGNTSTVYGDIDSGYYPIVSHGVYVINSSMWIQDGRDIHLNPPVGYVPYPYPHPLRNEPAGDFSIVSLDSEYVEAGENIAFSIYAEPTGGFAGPVAFSASGGPPGTVITWPRGTVWNAGGVNPDLNLILDIFIPLNAPLGDYPITVTGTST